MWLSWILSVFEILVICFRLLVFMIGINCVGCVSRKVMVIVEWLMLLVVVSLFRIVFIVLFLEIRDLLLSGD